MYSHLTKDQRVELAVLKREGFSLRQIAGRPKAGRPPDGTDLPCRMVTRAGLRLVEAQPPGAVRQLPDSLRLDLL